MTSSFQWGVLGVASIFQVKERIEDVHRILTEEAESGVGVSNNFPK